MGGKVQDELENLPYFKYGTKVVKNTGHSLSQLRARDDNIGSSVGITQYLHPEMKEPSASAPFEERMTWDDIHAPRDYFVPSFGMDKDIISTQEDERVASALIGHGWSFKTPESYEKYRLRSKDVDYNFNPDLDEDMIDSQASTGYAEQEYGRRIMGYGEAIKANGEPN